MLSLARPLARSLIPAVIVVFLWSVSRSFADHLRGGRYQFPPLYATRLSRYMSQLPGMPALVPPLDALSKAY